MGDGERDDRAVWLGKEEVLRAGMGRAGMDRGGREGWQCCVAGKEGSTESWDGEAERRMTVLCC